MLARGSSSRGYPHKKNRGPDFGVRHADRVAGPLRPTTKANILLAYGTCAHCRDVGCARRAATAHTAERPSFLAGVSLLRRDANLASHGGIEAEQTAAADRPALRDHGNRRARGARSRTRRSGRADARALTAKAAMRYVDRVGISQWFWRSGVEPSAAGWFRGARRVRVREVFGEGETVQPKVLYETIDPDEIASLVEALQTGPGGGWHCMCVGTLLYEIKSRVRTRRISLHHGKSLRAENEFENLPLLNPDACMDWLSARGITFVREEYDESRRRETVSHAQAERWRAALPASLAPFVDDMGVGGKPHPEWGAALAAEYPDLQRRAVMLLRLFGSGAGPWSDGYPSYENVPEVFLAEMPAKVLIAAATDALDDRVTEGAARLFSGWEFGRRLPDDRVALPAELKRRLLAHAERCENEDNRARARAAFGS
jgi:hypothetical protein